MVQNVWILALFLDLMKEDWTCLTSVPQINLITRPHPPWQWGPPGMLSLQHGKNPTSNSNKSTVGFYFVVTRGLA